MHSIHKLQKNFALKRKKRISKELKLGSDNDTTKSKILLRQIHKSNASFDFVNKKKKKKKKASFGICSELDFYLVDKFSQIQGDYNAFDSKIQLILVQCN